MACSAAAGAEPDHSLEIAPPSEALTFGRIETAEGQVPVMVTAYESGRVALIDLVCALGRPLGDAIAVFNQVGYERLRGVAEDPPDYCLRGIDARLLSMPVDLGDHHIAAGTNYPEHAGEAEVEDGPFLFAKLVEPTGPRSAVAAGEGLLDYEVELAWVTLARLRRGKTAEYLGLLLANEYTDRLTLLEHIDVSDVTSGVGFTTGKSFPGFLPVGNLFVIPADYRAFAGSLRLRLYVNGEKRQDALVSQAIWDIDEMIAQTWQRQDARWQHRGATVSLLPEPNVIEGRTMILGGTPSGTAFQGIPRATQVAGVGAWLLGGWDRSVVSRVAERYAADAREEGLYLVPGDRVVIEVDRMGVIDNTVR